MNPAGPGARIVLQVVLVLVIIVLGYWLYVSITEPYKAARLAQARTETTRERMVSIRTALIRYEFVRDRFPATLDSLVAFIKTDSLLSNGSDSVFGAGFRPDSMPFSPRSGRAFEYAVNDSTPIRMYFLKDPDSDDQIGSKTGDVTKVHTASWE